MEVEVEALMKTCHLLPFSPCFDYFVRPLFAVAWNLSVVSRLAYTNRLTSNTVARHFNIFYSLDTFNHVCFH